MRVQESVRAEEGKKTTDERGERRPNMTIERKNQQEGAPKMHKLWRRKREKQGSSDSFTQTEKRERKVSRNLPVILTFVCAEIHADDKAEVFPFREIHENRRSRDESPQDCRWLSACTETVLQRHSNCVRCTCTLWDPAVHPHSHEFPRNSSLKSNLSTMGASYRGRE